MAAAEGGEITLLLRAWRRGEEKAQERLMPLVYAELRKIAAGNLGLERADHTLQPTALVNEAYLRLADQKSQWKDRSHFFAVAAKMVRRILVDHARRHRSVKRGHASLKLPLEEIADLAVERPDLLVALDAALAMLKARDAPMASIVEYRFFGGLTGAETARVLGCSPATVKRKWRLAKAWLYRELSREVVDGH